MRMCKCYSGILQSILIELFYFSIAFKLENFLLKSIFFNSIEVTSLIFSMPMIFYTHRISFNLKLLSSNH